MRISEARYTVSEQLPVLFHPSIILLSVSQEAQREGLGSTQSVTGHIHTDTYIYYGEFWGILQMPIRSQEGKNMQTHRGGTQTHKAETMMLPNKLIINMSYCSGSQTSAKTDG